MAGKRHHYLPKLVLRRFSIAQGTHEGLIWRGGLDDRSLRRVAPKYEAARTHYYSLPPEFNLPPGFVEDTLMGIESLAGAAIARFERERALTPEDREALAIFLILQHRRTPTGRRELKFADEFMAKMYAELRISDKDAVREVLSESGRVPTEQQIAEWQTENLRQLREGEIEFESVPGREVALMFSNLESIVPKILTDFDWCLYLIPGDSPQLVLPDVGVTIYDPSPPFPNAGTGFASSPRSETVLYLDSRFVLMLRPGEGSGDFRDADTEIVEKLNRRAIACSDRCIYGAAEQTVSAALERLDREPELIDALRPKPPVFWIAETDGEPQAGTVEFVGHARTGTFSQELHVSQEGIDEARRNAFRVGS